MCFTNVSYFRILGYRVKVTACPIYAIFRRFEPGSYEEYSFLKNIF